MLEAPRRMSIVPVAMEKREKALRKGARVDIVLENFVHRVDVDG